MSKRKEKKEQKLREKLKKQGFSEEEIEKIVKVQRKKTTAKVVVGTLATAVVVAGIVFTVATVMKNNNITPTPTPTPTPDPTPTPKPTEEEIEKSKELEEEIKNDIEDKKPEEIDTKIDDKQNELDQAKQELEDLKNSGASEEEIAKAEEKQQEAEKQLEDAKEEQGYWTTTSRIKELYAQNLSNAEGYPNSYIRSIKDISYTSSDMVVDAEVISKDSNGILRQHNVVLKVFGAMPKNFNSAQGLSSFFQNCKGIEIDMEFNSSSTELEQNFFNNKLKSRYPNMTLLASNTIYDEAGKISKICLKTGYEHAQGYEYYIFNVARMSKDHTNEEVAEMIKNGEIRASVLKVFATEFLIYDWQNATFEYKGQEQSDEQITEEQQTEEQEAEELVNSFKSLDENGEEVLDYPAYQQCIQQMEAEKEAKELEQNMTQETKVTYSEQELGF